MGTSLRGAAPRAGRKAHARSNRGEPWPGNKALDTCVLQALRLKGPYRSSEPLAAFFGVGPKDTAKVPGALVRCINNGDVREDVADDNPRERVYTAITR